MIKYLLSDERYLIDRKVDEILKENAITKQDLDYCEPETTDEILNFSQSYSMFSATKIMVIKKIENEEEMSNLLSSISSDVIMLIIAPLDKRKKLYKKLKKEKYVEEIPVLDRKDLCSWIQGICEQYNQKISLKNAGLILDRTTTENMYNIQNEVLKLCDMNKDIDETLICNVIRKTITAVGFDLTNNMLSKNVSGSLNVLSEISTEVGDIIPLIALLNKNFSVIKSLRKTSQTTLREAGIDQYTLKNLSVYARNKSLYTDEELTKYIKLTEQADFDIKNGVSGKSVIEKLIFEMLKEGK